MLKHAAETKHAFCWDDVQNWKSYQSSIAKPFSVIRHGPSLVCHHLLALRLSARIYYGLNPFVSLQPTSQQKKQSIKAHSSELILLTVSDVWNFYPVGKYVFLKSDFENIYNDFFPSLFWPVRIIRKNTFEFTFQNKIQWQQYDVKHILSIKLLYVWWCSDMQALFWNDDCCSISSFSLH